MPEKRKQDRVVFKLLLITYHMVFLFPVLFFIDQLSYQQTLIT